MPSNNPIENTHMRFCKDLLGVQKQTSNIEVLLDLGRIPFMIYGEETASKTGQGFNSCKKANEIVLLVNKKNVNKRWAAMEPSGN